MGRIKKRLDLMQATILAISMVFIGFWCIFNAELLNGVIIFGIAYIILQNNEVKIEKKIFVAED